MLKLIKVLVITVLFCLSGCSSIGLQRLDSGDLKLLPLEEGPPASLIKQIIAMSSQGQEREFISVLKLQHDRLILVALWPTGQKLMELEYDGSRLTQQNFTPLDLDGELLTAVVQFVLWPEPSIRKNYPESEGWVLELGVKQRSLLTASGILLNVAYLENEIVIDNFDRDYRVKVKMLEKKDL
ncbi:MAG: DUF3261 domain-containing protein [Motiliproteus sp.]